MAMPAMINENDVRMPYVRFERVAFEDKEATLKSGHYVAKDVDMAYITPYCSKDIMKYKVNIWFDQLAIDARNNRIPNEWVDKYKKAYESWKNGQELPLDGIPIKGWGVISPAQQETLIRMHVLTVEQLADITSEGILRIGMGGQDLKNKAVAWLKSLKKSGNITIENAELKKQVESQAFTIEQLENKVKALAELVDRSGILKQSQPIEIISTDDILED